MRRTAKIPRRFETLETRRLLAVVATSEIRILGASENYADGGWLVQGSQSAVAGAGLLQNDAGSFIRTTGGNALLPSALVDSLPATDTGLNFDLDGPGSLLIEGMSAHRSFQNDLQLYLRPRDAEGRWITPANYQSFQDAEDAVLVEPLRDGDTQMVIDGSIRWSRRESDPAASRSLAIFFDASASSTLIPEIYTPLAVVDAEQGVWAPGGITVLDDRSIVTLSRPWDGGEIPVGTTVRNTDAARQVYDFQTQFIDRPSPFVEHIGPRPHRSLFSATATLRENEIIAAGGETPAGSLPPGTAGVEVFANQRVESVEATYRSNRRGPLTFESLARGFVTGSQTERLSDQDQPIAEDRVYFLSTSVRTDSVSSGDTHDVGYAAFDADGLRIRPEHGVRFAGSTDTRLAQSLLPGATQIVLSDATGWSNDVDPRTRTLAWYGYQDAAGRTYPDYSYTRNIAGDPVDGLWDQDAIEGNVIHLNQPWDGPRLGSGTRVRNADASGDAVYSSLASDVQLDQTWLHLVSDAKQGFWQDGVASETSFPPGTASVRGAIQANMSKFGVDDRVLIENFQVSTSEPQRLVPSFDGSYRVDIDLEAILGPLSGDDSYVVSQPSFGHLEAATDNVFRYTASRHFTGTDSFFAGFASDFDLARKISISVTGVQGAETRPTPAIDSESLFPTNGSRQVAENYSEYSVLKSADLEADGFSAPSLRDTLSDGDRQSDLEFRLLAGPEWGALDFRADGTFHYLATASGTNTSFRYEVTNGVRHWQGVVRIRLIENQNELVRDNVRRLAEAHEAFLDDRKEFPHSYHPSDETTRANQLSWRVHLLPQLGFHELYEQFRLDEPWDSPHNLSLVGGMPSVFGVGQPDATRTPLRHLVSNPEPFLERPAFVTDRRTRRHDLRNNHLLLVDRGDQTTVWTQAEPADFDFDEPLSMLSPTAGRERYGISAEGRVVRISESISEDLFRAATTPRLNAGEPIVDPVEFVSGEDRPLTWADPDVAKDKAEAIGQAMLDYFDAFKRYPAGIRYHGQPPAEMELSWKVSVLPWLGHFHLFDQFNRDEPWDTEHNLSVASEMPDVFRSEGDPIDSTTTRFRMVLGESAAFQLDENGFVDRLKLNQLADGASNTILYVEAGEDQRIPWTQPDPVNFDSSDPLATLGNLTGDTFRVIMGDGSVHRLPTDIAAADFKALVTRDGAGESEHVTEWTPVDTLLKRWGVTASRRTRTDLVDQSARIAEAWDDFRDEFRQLPPLVSGAEHTRPRYDAATGLTINEPNLSWRVHVLGYLGYENLARRFDWTKPWDHPDHLALLPLMPDVFRSIGDAAESSVTRFLAFSSKANSPDGCGGEGPVSCQAGGGGDTRLMRDGIDSTLFLAEVGQGQAALWTQPVDLFYSGDPVSGRIEDGYQALSPGTDRFIATYLNGAVIYLDEPSPLSLARKINTNDGAAARQPELWVRPREETVFESGITTLYVENRNGSADFPFDVEIESLNPDLFEVSKPNLTFESEKPFWQTIEVRGIPQSNGVAPAQFGKIRVGEQIIDLRLLDSPEISDEAMPPTVRNAVVNDGQPSRSIVDSVTVTIEGQVQLDRLSEAFSIVDQADRRTHPLLVDAGHSDDNGIPVTTVQIQFAESGTRFRPSDGVFVLPDGNYRLAIDPSRVRSSSGHWLDGDQDGIAGGGWVFGENAGDNFFALLGDGTGDGAVNLLDFGEFRESFGANQGDDPYIDAYDLNGDGSINLLDFAIFRTQFGSSRS